MEPDDFSNVLSGNEGAEPQGESQGMKEKAAVWLPTSLGDHEGLENRFERKNSIRISVDMTAEANPMDANPERTKLPDISHPCLAPEIFEQPGLSLLLDDDGSFTVQKIRFAPPPAHTGGRRRGGCLDVSAGCCKRMSITSKFLCTILACQAVVLGLATIGQITVLDGATENNIYEAKRSLHLLEDAYDARAEQLQASLEVLSEEYSISECLARGSSSSACTTAAALLAGASAAREAEFFTLVDLNRNIFANANGGNVGMNFDPDGLVSLGILKAEVGPVRATSVLLYGDYQKENPSVFLTRVSADIPLSELHPIETNDAALIQWVVVPVRGAAVASDGSRELAGMLVGGDIVDGKGHAVGPVAGLLGEGLARVQLYVRNKVKTAMSLVLEESATDAAANVRPSSDFTKAFGTFGNEKASWVYVAKRPSPVMVAGVPFENDGSFQGELTAPAILTYGMPLRDEKVLLILAIFAVLWWSAIGLNLIVTLALALAILLPLCRISRAFKKVLKIPQGSSVRSLDRRSSCQGSPEHGRSPDPQRRTLPPGQGRSLRDFLNFSRSKDRGVGVRTKEDLRVASRQTDRSDGDWTLASDANESNAEIETNSRKQILQTVLSWKPISQTRIILVAISTLIFACLAFVADFNFSNSLGADLMSFSARAGSQAALLPLERANRATGLHLREAGRNADFRAVPALSSSARWTDASYLRVVKWLGRVMEVDKLELLAFVDSTTYEIIAVPDAIGGIYASTWSLGTVVDAVRLSRRQVERVEALAMGDFLALTPVYNDDTSELAILRKWGSREGLRPLNPVVECLRDPLVYARIVGVPVFDTGDAWTDDPSAVLIAVGLINGKQGLADTTLKALGGGYSGGVGLNGMSAVPLFSVSMSRTAGYPEKTFPNFQSFRTDFWSSPAVFPFPNVTKQVEDGWWSISVDGFPKPPRSFETVLQHARYHPEGRHEGEMRIGTETVRVGAAMAVGTTIVAMDSLTAMKSMGNWNPGDDTIGNESPVFFIRATPVSWNETLEASLWFFMVVLALVMILERVTCYILYRRLILSRLPPAKEAVGAILRHLLIVKDTLEGMRAEEWRALRRWAKAHKELKLLLSEQVVQKRTWIQHLFGWEEPDDEGDDFDMSGTKSFNPHTIAVIQARKGVVAP
uniref:Uncharacterized protein n=1 Tax=Chromera velia CCMP2878 TaxID=1169474 RepID=A0A0G4IEK7_9ALVE|eukprot:Cvel_13727.t1-p1 / transcript=Cvel_13727.t1 / gene=Cvel_13727 / organism=Chromera_velia_CCMP2878 / gene_product=hypothetical protein / transcript_product=hypothetical protein / location=Cvel_scaffold949:43370-49473(-) / protein_length=1151 / sequence_SO=supercontig / SO=protein_coding / is_pseudo=false